LPALQDISFTGNANATSARRLAAAIQGARLADDEAYLFIASGQALASFGEWELARVAFFRAVAIAPDYAEAWAYLSEAQQQLGEDGLPALTRAIDLNAESLGVQLFAALYWQRQNDFDQANLHFHIASLLAPNDPSVQIHWGQNAVLAGNVVEAQEHFQQAVELAPDNLVVWRALAEYSLDTEIIVEELGLPAAQHLLKAFPRDSVALTFMGRAHALLEDEETARYYFERAILFGPSDASAHLHYALFLLSLGDVDHARVFLDQVIALAPGTAEAELASHWLGQTSH
jgi:tetratricopeptide (TPR) repeat protein